MQTKDVASANPRTCVHAHTPNKKPKRQCSLQSVRLGHGGTFSSSSGAARRSAAGASRGNCSLPLGVAGAAGGWDRSAAAEHGGGFSSSMPSTNPSVDAPNINKVGPHEESERHQGIRLWERATEERFVQGLCNIHKVVTNPGELLTHAYVL